MRLDYTVMAFKGVSSGLEILLIDEQVLVLILNNVDGKLRDFF